MSLEVPKLAAAVARHLGPPGEISALSRLTGGATKSTWSFDALVGGERLALILQLAAAGAAGPTAGLVRGSNDAALMRAAERAGVPAPRVRFVLDADDAIGEGHATDRVDGETLGKKIVSDPRLAAVRPRLAAQCGEILAAIHRIEASEVPFLSAQGPTQQLALYRGLVDHFDHGIPAVELGLRWVAENLPAHPRTTVVHGDFRNGNLIVGEDGVRCVLDWELAQLGDPMADLGWLCVKTWRFGGALAVGGFGRREDLFEAYEKASGVVVDPVHVRFWEAFGCIKWSIMCMLKGLGHRRGARGNVEAVAIGRRIEEPLLDFLDLVTGRE
ncbi:Putative aminoglycoside phosphotransferase [Myxococcaceae bacterium]|nr:Putative aminoglycoside phosphotransferase [Myxococcaceae bacterium]